MAKLSKRGVALRLLLKALSLPIQRRVQPMMNGMPWPRQLQRQERFAVAAEARRVARKNAERALHVLDSEHQRAAKLVVRRMLKKMLLHRRR